METEKPLGLKDYLFIAACVLVMALGWRLMNIHKSYILAACLMTALFVVWQIAFERDIISEEDRIKEQKHLMIMMIGSVVILDLISDGLELQLTTGMFVTLACGIGSSKIYNRWFKV